MYKIYESPRRSPRHVPPQSGLNSNVLKPKATSAVRKQEPTQSLKNLPTSARALTAVARDGIQKRGRKKKANDENKENGDAGLQHRRSAAINVNGVPLAKKAGPVHRKVETRDGRTPLKELPLNGFVDILRERDVVPSVEIVVFLL